MKYVEKAFSLSRTLQEMISVVLDISRMESGKMPLEKMECDLRNVVSEALTSLGTLVKRTTIVYEAPENPVHAYCDPGIIQRVVANLVANAVKFTGRSGEVRIAMSKGENNVTVTVADTGPGIPAEYHELIFEKFGQVKNRQKGTQYSSGLGLAFCKLAVETHGGRIDVESEVGKGSTFRFTMPSIP
jgi:signal transduction histidine kinase